MELCLGASILKRTQPDPAVESALVERCKRQDAEAFGKIVDAYQNRVYGFVRRMIRDNDEAADITQEVFIRAYQAFIRFDGRSSLRTWLFRIAHNLCVDRVRKHDRMPTEFHLDNGSEEDGPMDVADSRWDPQHLVLDDELRKVVETAIANMSEKLRSVLLLHDQEDLAYDEIAQALDLPIGTVKSRLFLARNHLQTVLSPYLKGEVSQ
ncbi:MAG TPA: sigma-70 family RNA polymerase sigma factor [Fimbriimonadaceae bacterium]|nr:sigma-70 family RNA polymerase sigma factor [Fimbriimonadaceae bacterium]